MVSGHSSLSSRRSQLWCDLKHRTEGLGAVRSRHPIQIACFIEDQVATGVGPWEISEAMKHTVFPSTGRPRRQLENHPIAMSAACTRRAVEIPGSVEDKTASGTFPIGPPCEGMQQALLPGSIGVWC